MTLAEQIASVILYVTMVLNIELQSRNAHKDVFEIAALNVLCLSPKAEYQLADL